MSNSSRSNNVSNSSSGNNGGNSSSRTSRNRNANHANHANNTNNANNGSKTCRGGLLAGRSTLPGGLMGLYTKVPLTAGSFVGFYCGEEKEDDGKDHSYGMTIVEGSGDSPGVTMIANPSKRPSADLLGYVNEPPAGKVANLTMISYYLYSPFGRTTKPAMAKAIAFYANRKIAASPDKPAELFVHYGKGYEKIRRRKNYEAGKEGPPIDRAKLEDPRLNGPSSLPLNCFVSLTAGEAGRDEPPGMRPRFAPNAPARPPAATKKAPTRPSEAASSSSVPARKGITKKGGKWKPGGRGRPPKYWTQGGEGLAAAAAAAAAAD